MKWNQNQFLRAEATGEPEGGEGLSARLESFLKENQAGDGLQPSEPKPAPAPVNSGDPPPATPEAPPADLPVEPEDDFEDDLPALGAPKPATAPDLDFDAQTDAIVKAIEAKGHPGDEYKRLRAELKAFKEQKPNLDTIPEVAELKQKAAEVDRIKAEAEALRQRNKELLQANDEVAVKESDEFINLVRKPIGAIEKMVEQIAQTAEIDASTLFSVIEERDIVKQDRMLEALHQKVGARTAGRIERFCDDYKAAQEKGAELLANSGKNAERARLARDQAAREEANQKAELFKSSVEGSFTNYAKRIPGFTDSSGNLTDLAKATMAKTASVDLHSLGADDLGYMAFAANVLPEARKAIVALQKELSILKGSKPAPKALDGSTAPQREPEDDYMGLAERMKGMEFTFTPPS